MKLVFFLLLSFSFSAWAHQLDFQPYLQMQEALAADDFKTALASHERLCKDELTMYKASYRNCQNKFTNIEELRVAFKALSDLYFQHGDKKEIGKLQKATCPMAKAKWIQKPGELRNPYYGKAMLDCGEKI
ncbi:MAG: DUF3347 domain-containing protein [Bacteriovoracaceae bacterium]|nr:DUF3347 domain-containing protein [Bacteriovoracaceae bacterium]